MAKRKGRYIWGLGRGIFVKKKFGPPTSWNRLMHDPPTPVEHNKNRKWKLLSGKITDPTALWSLRLGTKRLIAWPVIVRWKLENGEGYTKRLWCSKFLFHDQEELRRYRQYSEELRGLCTRAHDCAFYVMFSTTGVDIMSLTRVD